MRSLLSATIFSILSTAAAQKVGTLVAENPPPLTWYKCVLPNTCTGQSGKVTLDAEWRWLHYYQNADSCYPPWNPVYCPPENPPPCAQNCALEGADYAGTYGITTSGNAINLKYVTQGPSGPSVGSRVYMVSTTDSTKYEIWKLLNKEFSFDVDVSNLPCGVKGSLYFVEMDADGGKAKYPPNLAGAKYGTGYCDSKCTRNYQWVNGEANVLDILTSTDPAWIPHYGSCCGEVDLFEANKYASAFSAHPCSTSGQTRCEGSLCSHPDGAGGYCDADGCDWNSYRLGSTSFYGASKAVDTTKRFTVVTQFITSDGTDNGQLVEIKRFYLQNGVVIPNNNPTLPGLSPSPAYMSIKDNFCADEKAAFGETNYFATLGGLNQVGQSLKRGGVLVFSISDDKDRNMQWLDGVWPQDQDPTVPGVARGSCSATSGYINDIRASEANASVTFSNVRIGVIGSTTSPTTGSGTATTTTTTITKTTTTTTTTTASGALQSHWGVCQAPSWTGPTACQAPYTCKCIVSLCE